MSGSPENNSLEDPKRGRHKLELYAAKAVVFALSLLPMGMAAWVGRRLGDAVRLIDRNHRKRAYKQIEERLGLTGKEAARFVKANFQHYGMVLAEIAVMSRAPAEELDRYIDYADMRELIPRLMDQGKGVVFITPHYGNWELCNKAGLRCGAWGGSIARPLDNPLVNEFVRDLRERNGMRILDKEGAIRKALRILKDKGAVGVLIDQDAGRNGMMSPFLGLPASTLTIPVELALRTGSPMLPVALRRNNKPGGKRFTLLHGPEVRRANPDADPREETHRLVDLLNGDLSRIILEEPVQWLWIHRRWKSVGVR